MKVLFVTQDDPFYLPVFFREMARVLDRNLVQVVGVVIQRPLGKTSQVQLMAQMIAFYGPLDFVRVGVRYVLRKLVNAVAVGVFRGKFPGAFSVRHIALREQWPILPMTNVNSPAFLEVARTLKPDVIASAAASQKFKSDVLAAAKYGCINIHTAKLPRNRGMMPNFWSLYHYDEDPISAVTVHKMNADLDDGEIVLQEEFRLDPSEPLHRLTLRTKVQGARVMARAITLYSNGEPPTAPNDRTNATYNTFPTREDVQRFRAKGLSLL